MSNKTHILGLKEKCLRMAIETPFESVGFENSSDVIAIAEKYYHYITKEVEPSGAESPTYTGPIALQPTS